MRSGGNAIEIDTLDSVCWLIRSGDWRRRILFPSSSRPLARGSVLANICLVAHPSYDISISCAGVVAPPEAEASSGAAVITTLGVSGAGADSELAASAAGADSLAPTTAESFCV